MNQNIQTLSYGTLANAAMTAALGNMPEEAPVLLVQTMSNYKSGVHEKEPYGRVLALAKQAHARGGSAHIEQVWQHVDRHPELLADRVRHAESDYGHKVSLEDHRLGKQSHLNLAIVLATHDVKRTRDDSADLMVRYKDKELTGSYSLYLNEQAPHLEMLRMGLRNQEGEDKWGPWLVGVHASHSGALSGPAILAYESDPWYRWWTTAYERYRNTAQRYDEMPVDWGNEDAIYRSLEASHHFGLALQASKEAAR